MTRAEGRFTVFGRIGGKPGLMRSEETERRRNRGANSVIAHSCETDKITQLDIIVGRDLMRLHTAKHHCKKMPADSVLYTGLF